MDGDKTSEEYHHLTVGSHLTKRAAVSVEVPYIVRYSLEVEDHDILGTKQKSKSQIRKTSSHFI